MSRKVIVVTGATAARAASVAKAARKTAPSPNSRPPS